MINIKIEVLTGLHSGATWEFNGGEVSVGGSSMCSVFLCDQVLPDSCLKLKIIGNRVLLVGVNAELEGASELIGREGKWIYPDQAFVFEYQGVRFSLSILDASAMFLSRIGNYLRRKAVASAELVQGMGLQFVLGVSFCLGLASTVTVLFLGSVGANKAEAKEYKDLENKIKLAEVAAKPNQVIDSVKQELMAFASAEKIKLNQFEIKDDAVTLAAEMTRIQLKSFENTLQNLARDYGSSVSISARLSLSKEQMLVDEIDVRSVSFGNQPVVTLRGGERLFLDSFYNDLRLVEVSANRIVLVGQSATYELPL